MIRTQIQLTEEQAEALKEAAQRQRISMAELIRRAVDRILAEADEDAKWRRASAVIGRYHSGTSDIAERHDEYLAEAYR